MKYLISIFIIVSVSYGMTIQRPDLLKIENEVHRIRTYPLVDLKDTDSLVYDRLNYFSEEELEISGKDTSYLVFINSNCWREFACSWIIVNDKLYLESIENCVNGKTVPLDAIFNNSQVTNGKVLAYWYTGEFELWSKSRSHILVIKIENGNVIDRINKPFD